jgi:ribonuclease E
VHAPDHPQPAEAGPGEAEHPAAHSVRDAEADLTPGQTGERVEASDASHMGEAAIMDREERAFTEPSSSEPPPSMVETPVEASETAREAPLPSQAPSQPVPEPAPAAEEPPRPRRSGWWQRARASIVGE